VFAGRQVRSRRPFEAFWLAARTAGPSHCRAGLTARKGGGAVMLRNRLVYPLQAAAPQGGRLRGL